MEDKLFFKSKCKTTSIFNKMEDDLNLKKKTTSISNKMEDDLNLLQNGRLPHFLRNFKTTSFFLVEWKTTSIFNKMEF
jgi:hypothetical protein